MRRPRIFAALAAALAAALTVALGAACGGGEAGGAHAGHDMGAMGGMSDAAAEAAVPRDWSPVNTPPTPLLEGKRLFEANCIGCHGPWAAGTDHGPPLVHRYYLPGHHSDEAFQRAVALGVQPHHWRFGPMPPVPGLDRRQVAAIIGYVRWLQRQGGIEE
ncbi:MAG TPA: cytochrome c [Gemmatimonadales bacterium]|nr:cytochrome c [Gemmatimonadales bacterium]